MIGKLSVLVGWAHGAPSVVKEFCEVISTLVLGEIGRWCFGGGKLRERVGDLIICLLLFYFLRPWVPALPEFFGVKPSAGSLALALALLGGHVVGHVLFEAFKKRTGIDLKGGK